jgi:hypothetical protein
MDMGKPHPLQLHFHDIAEYRRIVHDENLSIRLGHFSVPLSDGCRMLSLIFSASPGKTMNPFSKKSPRQTDCSMVYGKK